jgi:hypothetical protein
LFYEFAIAVPANTPASAPLDTDVQLVAGVITWVEVQFPDGCFGLAHAKILHDLHQVWPTNTDGDISANNEHVDWFESYEMNAEPYDLTLRAWNDDDSFPHTLTFRFAVTPAAAVAQQRVALSALNYLAQWFSQQPAPPAGSA